MTGLGGILGLSHEGYVDLLERCVALLVQQASTPKIENHPKPSPIPEELKTWATARMPPFAPGEKDDRPKRFLEQLVAEIAYRDEHGGPKPTEKLITVDQLTEALHALNGVEARSLPASYAANLLHKFLSDARVINPMKG